METYWYNHKKPKERAQSLVETVDGILQDQSSRYSRYERFAALYKDQIGCSMKPGEFGKESPVPDLYKNPNFNVIRSCINSLHSRLTVTDASPFVATSNAPENLKREAKKLERFISGAMQSSKASPSMWSMCRDALCYGIGYVRGYVEDGKLLTRCVYPGHVIIDDNAAFDGRTLTMYQLSFTSREMLRLNYPDADEEAFDKAEEVGVSHGGTNARDLVRVVEGWKLPFGKSKGCYCVATLGGELETSEYKAGDFPFVKFTWMNDLAGCHGIGVAEELLGIQQMLNFLIDHVKTNVELTAQVYIAVPANSRVSEEFLQTVENAKIMKYEGNNPPSITTPPVAHPQIFSWIETLKGQSYNQIGLSEMSATSERPGSLRTGLALMTWRDIETSRFAQQARRWDLAFEDLFKMLVRIGSTIDNWSMKSYSKKSVDKIKFSEINLDEDEYVVSIMPRSSIPETASGRVEYVVQLSQMGIVDPQEARRLLSLPDVDKYQDLATAQQELFAVTFEQILDKGTYVPPPASLNLEYAIKLCSDYIARAYLDGIPEENIGQLERWQVEAMDVISGKALEATQEQAPPMGPEGMAPGMPLPGQIPGPIPGGGMPPEGMPPPPMG